jgi:hypothetical protein
MDPLSPPQRSSHHPSAYLNFTFRPILGPYQRLSSTGFGTLRKCNDPRTLTSRPLATDFFAKERGRKRKPLSLGGEGLEVTRVPSAQRRAACTPAMSLNSTVVTLPASTTTRRLSDSVRPSRTTSARTV